MIFVPLVLAAAVSGSGIVDRTATCQVAVQAGVPIVTLLAAPVSTFIATDGSRQFLNAGLWVKTDDRNGSGGATLLGVANVLNGYAAPAAAWCKPAPRIPLAPGGVPREGVYARYSNGLGDGQGARCGVGTRVTIRLRATILKGQAVAAQLAIRSGKRQRPIAFVDWTPTRVTTYLTDDCQS